MSPSPYLSMYNGLGTLNVAQAEKKNLANDSAMSERWSCRPIPYLSYATKNLYKSYLSYATKNLYKSYLSYATKKIIFLIFLMQVQKSCIRKIRKKGLQDHSARATFENRNI